MGPYTLALVKKLLLVIAVLALLAGAGSAGAGSDPWAAAAQKLSMPVFAPTKTFGMALKRVHPHKIDCGDVQEELEAYYGASEKQKLTILEGKPFYCGDLGDAPLLATLRIHGKKASLYSYCQGTGCQKASDTYALYWREQGVQIALISRGTPRGQLIQIAKSTKRVDG